MDGGLRHFVVGSVRRITVGGMAVITGVAGLAAGSAQASSAPDWRVAYRANSATENGLGSVTAPGRRDAWSVGNVGSSVPGRPLILHWNGSAWRRVTVHGAGGIELMYVRASSPRNVWVFGYLSLPTSQPAELLRWDGTAWHVLRPPVGVGFSDPVVLGPLDVWVTGTQTNCLFAGSAAPKCTTDLWHWDGRGWHRFTLNTMLGGFGDFGMDGTAHTVWAVGMNQIRNLGTSNETSQLVAYRWNGRAWQWVQMPHPRVSDPPEIHVASASNVWIVATAASRNAAFALHWDGRAWHTIWVPPGIDFTGPVAPDGRSGLWFGMFAHWTGRQWISPIFGEPDGTWNFFEFALVPGTTTVWAAGVVSRTFNSNISESIIEYNGALPR